ncbi:acyl-CoA dehydrogenase family protein [Effusibacillus dendaii]|uniref:Acyl-CoA dehydrogenase n=1 Tax=Effusibacillus dendaii TaxID=2743772 RepID=A0A7I8DCG6_9BACL|nr:acyl-CoA dehydrogenase family protein [Effusibacillus dendaii]BCJ85611.1 acyl-CoA dehydrogenase [Effusibacillus dendaii]
MHKLLELPVVKLSEETEKLREEVRKFISEELNADSFEPKCDSWLGELSQEFSRKLGERGWIGMTWPKKYGGHERTAIERFVVTEELLAAGAPVAGHWIADRQTGPLLLRYGTEEQRQFFLPKIAKGECYFAIGLSEPNAGSDLAGVLTSATKVEQGWILNGSKLWSSGAHHAHYMIVLCRTSPQNPENRHQGMSQLLVDLSANGVTIRPIRLMNGEHHFNEVIFEDVFISDDMLVGEVGNGWKQGMAELAYERSGPERFLSTFPLLVELVDILQDHTDKRIHIEIGQLAARLRTLRHMSLGVASLLQRGVTPDIAAALVKDLGTQFERDVAEIARLLVSPRLTAPSAVHAPTKYEKRLAEALLHAPGFTLRGGTTEILRGIVAKGVAAR